MAISLSEVSEKLLTVVLEQLRAVLTNLRLVDFPCASPPILRVAARPHVIWCDLVLAFQVLKHRLCTEQDLFGALFERAALARPERALFEVCRSVIEFQQLCTANLCIAAGPVQLLANSFEGKTANRCGGCPARRALSACAVLGACVAKRVTVGALEHGGHFLSCVAEQETNAM